ncbi:MAG TPA: alcohol dehydrogenase catalytic domain-containing protein [Pseudonocardia sp.]|jgi:alcohol dehydrogenase|nr:alcohol dehydrogenase catalytic domain-containing protein [Pseudonocardia sp.]
MRALTFEGPGRVAWRDQPDPTLPPAGALVRPLAVARCDLDAAMALHGLFPGPYCVGHECVAEVIEVADGVASLAPGQRVVVPFQVSCGDCIQCRAGRFAACVIYRAPAGAAFGFGPAGGGHGGALADVLAVPNAEHLLLAAPERLSDTALCLLSDNVSDGYRTVAEHLFREPGADVLVVGGYAASIGLYAVACAVALGAGRVRYLDTDPARVAVAGNLGAEAVVHTGDWPRRFDRARITVDNTGTPRGLATVLRSTDDYGYCTSVAIHFEPVTEVPLLEMYTRGVTFHVSRTDSRRLLPQVLDLVVERRLDPLAVPVTSVDWADAERAWLAPATKLVARREPEAAPV